MDYLNKTSKKISTTEKVNITIKFDIFGTIHSLGTIFQPNISHIGVICMKSDSMIPF